MMATSNEKSLSLLNFPHEILSRIFSYLLYDEISNKRIVCRQFNDVAQRLLCNGFLKVSRQQQEMLKKLRSQLPRRESERRVHPLSRKSDILDAIETRLSLLNMTYNKYIEAGLCCFIPGKVLDELLRVMAVVENSQCPPRSNELLQELRDISSMAMEHFDEKIVPLLKNKSSSIDKTPRFGSLISTDLASRASSSTGCMGLFIRQTSRPAALLTLRKELSELSSKVAELQRKLQEHERALLEKDQKLLEQDRRLSSKLFQLNKLQIEVNRQKRVIKQLSVKHLSSQQSCLHLKSKAVKNFAPSIKLCENLSVHNRNSDSAEMPVLFSKLSSSIFDDMPINSDSTAVSIQLTSPICNDVTHIKEKQEPPVKVKRSLYQNDCKYAKRPRLAKS